MAHTLDLRDETAFIQITDQTGIKPKAPVQHKPVPAGWCFDACAEQNFCGMCLVTIKRYRMCGATPPHGLVLGSSRSALRDGADFRRRCTNVGFGVYGQTVIWPSDRVVRGLSLALGAQQF